MRRIALRVTLALLLSVCALPTAEAQPTPQTPPPPEPPPPAAPILEHAAQAEIEAPAPDVAQPTPTPEMRVTGTRIQSPSSGTAAPLEIIDRTQLERSGVSNLADAVQYLTSTQGTGPQGNVMGGPAGPAVAAVNLRGVGTGSTLVLLNGRRLNPAGAVLGAYQDFGDLSTIPLAAIDRIEILRGGASAIYGADAVAGVFNVITRRGWEGAKLQSDGRITTRGDHGEFTLSGAVGAIGRRARVHAAASYFRRTQLLAGERDITRGKFVGTVGGYPGTFIQLPAGIVQADPACEMPSPDGCLFSYRNYVSLFPSIERGNAFASAEYDVTPHTTLYGELLVSRYRGDATEAPSFPVFSPLPMVPADHVDNPWSAPQLALLTPLGAPDHPASRSAAADDTLRGVVGLKGDLEALGEDTLLESWEWDLSTAWSSSRFWQSLRDNLADALQSALDSCSDPGDLSDCFNPFFSASDATGSPNPQRVLDRISARQITVSDHSLQTFHAGASGTLFALPGGPLGAALGAEIRRERRSTEYDHDSLQRRYGFLIGNSNNIAERDVYGGYLELRWPLSDGVELQTAARLEHYSDIDRDAASPFGGLTLVPASIAGKAKVPRALQSLRLRATMSRPFRAPTLVNAFPGLSVGPMPLTYRGGPAYVPVFYYGNPQIKPESAWTFTTGFDWAPIPELSLTADFWYYRYKNRIESENPQQILNNHQVLMDMGASDPRVTVSSVGAIAAVRSNTINVPGALVTYGIDFAATVTITGATLGLAREAFGSFRLGAQGTYTIAYDLPRFELSQRILPDQTTLPPKDCEGTASTSSCHVAGKRNASNIAPSIPQLRLNVPLLWTHVGHEVGITVHHISGLEDDVAPNQDGSLDEIAAFLACDLHYGYALRDVIGQELTLRIGVANLFDAPPPAANGTDAGWTFDLHDTRGRMAYAKLSAEF